MCNKFENVSKLLNSCLKIIVVPRKGKGCRKEQLVMRYRRHRLPLPPEHRLRDPSDLGLQLPVKGGGLCPTTTTTTTSPQSGDRSGDFENSAGARARARIVLGLERERHIAIIQWYSNGTIRFVGREPVIGVPKLRLEGEGAVLHGSLSTRV